MQKHVSYPLARALYESGVRLETEFSWCELQHSKKIACVPTSSAIAKAILCPAPDLPELLDALPMGYSDENYENDYELTLRKDPVANQYVFRYENGISLAMADIAVAHEATVESAGLLLLELKKRDLV